MPRTYRVLRWLVSLLLSAFFRRIEVSGLDNVPQTGGGLVVAWHPNALVDPALIFITFPRQVVFGARHGIFDWPIIGHVVRIIGTIPIYRAEDLAAADADAARRQANEASLDAMAQSIGEGRFAALFPEGLSHDEPAPKALKTGAARIYYRVAARSETGSATILPVGLYYDKKGLLGSSVLVVYHPPLEIPPGLAHPETDPEAHGDKVRRLTAEIEQSLRNIVYATENWKVHYLLHRARKVVRAERAARSGRILSPPTMAERVLAFRRLWTGYNALRESHPEQVGQLLRRIARYDAELAGLSIDDHELDPTSIGASRWLGFRLLLRSGVVFIALPPLLLAGFVINLPPAATVWAISKWRSKQEKDEATTKLLAGAGIFPAAWLAASIWIARVVPVTDVAQAWLIGASAYILSVASGWLVLHYRRVAGETSKAIRLRSMHSDNAHVLARLRDERRAICDEVVALAAGLDLPGAALPDGRVLDENLF